MNIKQKEEEKRAGSVKGASPSVRGRGNRSGLAGAATGLPVAHSCARLHSRNSALRSVIVSVQRACHGHSVKNNSAKQQRFRLQRQVWQRSCTKRRAVAGRNAARMLLRPADRSRDPTGSTQVFFPGMVFFRIEFAVFRVHVQRSTNKRKIRVVNTDFMTCPKSCFYL